MPAISHIRSIFAVGVAPVLTVASALPAGSQTPAEFFAGKTVTISVGYTTGGGYDIYARALAPSYGKLLPGKPTVIVKNVPGGGSLKLATYLQSAAPRDGTEFGTIARGVPVEELLGGTKTGFDPIAVNWIGSMNNEVSICAVMTSTGVKTLADLKTKELSFGTQGKGSDSELFAVFVRNLFGLKGKVVSGYPGTQESILAMERGEVDGNCGWSWTSAKQLRPQWIKDGTMTIYLQLALTKHPELPNVPLIADLVKTPEEKAQVELVVSRQTMGRPFVAPPGVPADRVAAMRKAFIDAMADPEFVALAERAKLEINPVSGEEVQRLVERILKAPQAVVEATKKNLGD
jgi:tripartite-type tricarboxylate transporter receptor subunit TctC